MPKTARIVMIGTIVAIVADMTADVAIALVATPVVIATILSQRKRGQIMNRPEYDPRDDWEEFEDTDSDGICSACKEHSSPVYLKHVITGEKIDPESNCCNARIEVLD